MKKIIIGLLTLSSATVYANSPEFDLMVSGATYAALTDNVCGLHVEKRNDYQLVVTAVKNPRTDLPCNGQGWTFNVSCNGSQRCFATFSNKDSASLQIMSDGNFTFRYDAYDSYSMSRKFGETIKFIRYP
ncbi:MAG: hypothetical protein ACOYL6_16860 [Bacteriovoracaceae bacterium]